MPSRTNSTTAKPAEATTSKRFELPALEFKFGSLTDGTDIPPPVPSPIQEKAGPTPPETPKVDGKHDEVTNGKPDSALSPKSQVSSITTSGTKRRAEDNPASPTFSNRPGSIRRLFSRGLLNNAYTNGDGAPAQDGRPESRSNSSVADSRRAKRSSGWFGRLRGSDGAPAKATTPLSPPATMDEKKPAGPPPPMIPEISELKSKIGVQDESGFGGDLFKDIK
ncbi:hypothetical protein MMYC01_202083 [Madurella mycetomatis]|uniref:Uncharacterized protein n=1 Tax=Madurella mycetomatis TaxID=100816 RepID=A0A175WBH1_9PEZI|nr:hypothetical protein MMYC01_202083 [Madurella mycetomatis]